MTSGSDGDRNRARQEAVVGEFRDMKATRGLTGPRHRERWNRAKMIRGKRRRVCNLISGH